MNAGAWSFLVQHRAQILGATPEHLTLVFIAMAVAILIGEPVGMLVVQPRTLRRNGLGQANFFRTIRRPGRLVRLF